jgi:hypothetical protein
VQPLAHFQEAYGLEADGEEEEEEEGEGEDFDEGTEDAGSDEEI